MGQVALRINKQKCNTSIGSAASWMEFQLASDGFAYGAARPCTNLVSAQPRGEVEEENSDRVARAKKGEEVQQNSPSTQYRPHSVFTLFRSRPQRTITAGDETSDPNRWNVNA